jgi:hypothetical protein
MVDWVVSRRVNESCYVGSLTRRGLTFDGWALLPCFAFDEASSCPCVDMLERCWREVDCLPMVKPDAASHLGIRHVCTCAF